MINMNQNLKVITAVTNYKKSTSRVVDIPVTNLYVCNFDEPVWASYIGVIAHQYPYMRNFVGKWDGSKLDPSELDEIKRWCTESDTDTLLSFFLQGTLELIPHSKLAEPETIRQENIAFVTEALMWIHSKEAVLWQLLNRGRQFIPQHGGGLMSFQKYKALLQEKDPGLNQNSIALYANVDQYIKADGTHQLQDEFIERMRELQSEIKKAV